MLLICAKLKREAGMYGIYYASLAFADLLLMGPCLVPQVLSHNSISINYYYNKSVDMYCTLDYLC